AVRTDLPLAMAVHTPSHLQGVQLGDAVAAVGRAAIPHLDLLHRLDRAVALLTLQAGVDVTHVREVGVVRQIVDADPRNRLLLTPVGDELLHFRAVRRDQRRTARNVTAGAYLHGRNARIDRAIRRVVAVHAGNLVGARVYVVRKCDGLFDTAAEGAHGE